MLEPGTAIRRYFNWSKSQHARRSTISTRTSVCGLRISERFTRSVLSRRCHMTRKLAAFSFVLTVGFLLIGIPLFAHHGTAGVYDNTVRITTKATVTQYIWANPHVQVY